MAFSLIKTDHVKPSRFLCWRVNLRRPGKSHRRGLHPAYRYYQRFVFFEYLYCHLVVLWVRSGQWVRWPLLSPLFGIAYRFPASCTYPPSCTQPYSTLGDYVTWVTTTYTLANGAATTTQAEAIYNQIRTEDGRTNTQQVAIFNHTMWINGVGTVHVMTTTPISTCRVSGVQGWPKSYDGPLATGASTSAGGSRDISGTVGSGDVSSHPIASLPKVTSTGSALATASLPILPITGTYPIDASIQTIAAPSTSPTAPRCPISSSLSVPAGHVTATSATGIGVGCALAGALIPALAACLLKKRLSLRFKRKKRLGEMNDVRSTVVGKLAKETSRLAAAPL